MIIYYSKHHYYFYEYYIRLPSSRCDVYKFQPWRAPSYCHLGTILYLPKSNDEHVTSRNFLSQKIFPALRSSSLLTSIHFFFQSWVEKSSAQLWLVEKETQASCEHVFQSSEKSPCMPPAVLLADPFLYSLACYEAEENWTWLVSYSHIYWPRGQRGPGHDIRSPSPPSRSPSPSGTSFPGGRPNSEPKSSLSPHIRARSAR